MAEVVAAHTPVLPPIGGGSGHTRTTRSNESLGSLARRGDHDQQLPPPQLSLTGSPQPGRLTRKRAAAMTLDETNHHPRIENLSLKTPSGSITPPHTGNSMTDVICLCTPAPKVPRPRNAFILYRQGHQAAVVKANPNLANPEISKIIGEQWRREPESVKDHWRKLAEQEKENHRDRNPGYRYRPRRGGKGAVAGRSASAGLEPEKCEKCGNNKFATATPRTPSSSVGPRTPGGLNTPTFASGPVSAGYERRSPRSDMMSYGEEVGVGMPRRLYHPGHQQLRREHGLGDIDEDYEVMSPTDASYMKRRRYDKSGSYHPVMSPSPSPYAIPHPHSHHQQPQHRNPSMSGPSRPGYNANGPLPAPASLGRLPGTPHPAVTMGPPPRPSISMANPYNGSPGALPPPPPSAASASGRYDFENVRLPPLQTHLATSPTRSEANTSGGTTAADRAVAYYAPTRPQAGHAGSRGLVNRPPFPDKRVAGLGIMTPTSQSQQQLTGPPGSAHAAAPSAPGQPPAAAIALRPNPLIVPAVQPASSSRDSHARSIEAMVMSIPYTWKIEALRRIAPPLAPPRPGSPAVECRGVVVAVEGASARLVAMVSKVVERVLLKAGGAGGEMDVKIWGPREDAKKPAAIIEEDAAGEKMDVDEETEKTTSSSVRAGSDETEGTNTEKTRTTSTDDADGETDPDAPRASITTTTPRRPSVAFPPLARRDSSPPVLPPYGPYLATIMEWHSRNEDIVRHITTLPPPTTTSSSPLADPKDPKQRIPVALVTGGFAVTVSDRFASTVLIPDLFAPVDHWNWMAQLWRGIVGADLVVYARSERRNGGVGHGRARGGSGSGGEEERGVEAGVEFPVPGVMAVWVDEGRGVEERVERRLEFEIVEWVRGKWMGELGEGMGWGKR